MRVRTPNTDANPEREQPRKFQSLEQFIYTSLLFQEYGALEAISDPYT